MKFTHYQKGFTLVELLIVVVVLTILAAITVIGYNGLRTHSIESSLMADVRNTAVKIGVYKVHQGNYPVTLDSSTKAESPTNVLAYQSDSTTYCIAATTKQAKGPSFYAENDGVVQKGSCPRVWTQLSTGGYHSLALASNGDVYAWGLNSGGQLGDGTNINRATPVNISSSGALAGKSISQVFAGGGQSFAIASDGTLYGWGGNGTGQLGDGTTTNRWNPIALSTSGALAGKQVKLLSAGESHVLALMMNGSVYAWGTNGYGRLGDGANTNRLSPVLISSSGVLAGKTIVQVSAGGLQSLALASDGTVYAWGGNTFGQVGDGTLTNRFTPVSIAGSGALTGKTIAQVNASLSDQSFAIASDGTAYAWGMNLQGQLGNNTTSSSSIPVGIYNGGALAGQAISTVVAGYDHTISLTVGGTPFAWGRNVYGQVGDGTTSDRTAPVSIAAASALSGKPLKQIGNGYYSSLALDYGGTIYAWGRNNYGQFGDGTNNDNPSPVIIRGPQ